MRYIFIFLFCAITLSNCGARRKLLNTHTADSVRVEVIERIERVTDTVKIEIPMIRDSVRVEIDSTSYLSNEVAESYAAVKGGKLSHSLKTKPQEIIKEVVIDVQVRDSIVFRNVETTNVVEVERELNAFQKFRLTFFWVVVAAGAAFIFGKFKPF